MKISYEYVENIYDYFEGFQEKIDKKELFPMSMFTMDAIRIWSLEMEYCFYRSFVQKLNKIKNNNKILEEYKIYIILIRKSDNPHSKIDNYYKLWKKLQRDIDLNGLILGKEEKININKDIFWCGIAEVPINKLILAFRLSSLGTRSLIFMAKKIEDSFCLVDMIQLLFCKRDTGYGYDLFQATIYCCLKGYILIRHWNALEEQSIALIFNPQINPIEPLPL